jgi:hypothetical protein
MRSASRYLQGNSLTGNLDQTERFTPAENECRIQKYEMRVRRECGILLAAWFRAAKQQHRA